MSALGITDPRTVLRNASAIRLSFGVAGLLWPARNCSACGIPGEQRTEETEYLMRLFAARDLLLAMEHLAASFGTDEEVEQALRGAASTGVADAVATLFELGRRRTLRGGLRAGLVFLVTDGIGFPVTWRRAVRRTATS